MEDNTQTIEERLQAAETERDEARADLTTAQERVTELEGSVTELTTERDTAQGRVTELETELADTQEERDTAQGRVTELETEARSAEVRAQELLAETGHPPLALGQDGGGAPTGAQGSLMEQYEAITDPREKTAFYRKHKAAMIAEARKAEAKS